MKKLTHIKAIGFDLDGTLVDSVPGLAEAIRLTFYDLSLPSVTNEQVNHWVGNGVDILIQRALTAVNAPSRLQLQAKEKFTIHYTETVKTGTVLYPNVLTTLEKLSNYPIRLAIITNKPSQFLSPLLTSLNIEYYFSLILGGDDVIKQKPHPAPLYLTLATFGLLANEFLFVGDSKNDVLAAKNANCPVVGLTYGYNYGEAITKSDPHYSVDHFEDILSIIEL